MLRCCLFELLSQSARCSAGDGGGEQELPGLGGAPSVQRYVAGLRAELAAAGRLSSSLQGKLQQAEAGRAAEAERAEGLAAGLAAAVAENGRLAAAVADAQARVEAADRRAGAVLEELRKTLPFHHAFHCLSLTFCCLFTSFP